MPPTSPPDPTRRASLRLVTLGDLRLEQGGVPVDYARHRRRLALLAAAASGGVAGMPRERLLALFWPDVDPERARSALNQLVYNVRRDLGPVLAGGAQRLALDPAHLEADVTAFRDALAAGERRTAVRLYGGTFLEGFRLGDAPAFDDWAEEEATRLRAEAMAALQGLARDDERRDGPAAALEWRERLVQLDPLDSAHALGYLRLLESLGEREAALRFASRHEQRLRSELGVSPSAEVAALVGRLRRAPPPPRSPAPPSVSGDAATPPPAPAPPARPRRRRLVTASALFMLAAAGLSTAALARRGAQRDVVAVAPLARADGGTDSLGPAIRDLLTTAAAQLERTDVVATTWMDEVARTAGDAGRDTSSVDVARRAGARTLVTGRWAAPGDGAVALDLALVDVARGRVLHTIRVRARDPFALADSAMHALAAFYRVDAPEAFPPGAIAASLAAQTDYLEGVRLMYAGQAREAARRFRAALLADSSFAPAAYWLFRAAAAAGDPDAEDALERALRLAGRLPRPEGLLLRTQMEIDLSLPAALRDADSLALLMPFDARAQLAIGRARFVAGDLDGASTALAAGRRLAPLGAGSRAERPLCTACDLAVAQHLLELARDSLAAAGRIGEAYERALPDSPVGPLMRASVAYRLGRYDEGVRAARRSADRARDTLTPFTMEEAGLLHADRFAEAEAQLVRRLAGARERDREELTWLRLIALRNQGRRADAARLALEGGLPDDLFPTLRPGHLLPLAVAQVLVEAGRAHEALGHYGQPVSGSRFPSIRARAHAWALAQEATARAALGDTVALARLADTLAAVGPAILSGNAQRLHHWPRGLVAVARGDDAEAVRQFRAALVSPTTGFTRINYELGRSLLRLGRAEEAAAIVEPALRGDYQSANFYVTRTELHELAAQAWEAAGRADRARPHWRVVAESWAHADADLQPRRREAARRAGLGD